MGWSDRISDASSLLLRKTFMIMTQVHKIHLNVLIFFFLPGEEDVVSEARTADTKTMASASKGSRI
jgi:hypothetical protein